MSRQEAVKHWSRLLSKWPKDPLRPENQQFQKLLQARIAKAPTPARNEDSEVNAAYLLLDNAVQKRFPAAQSTMQPASNPTLYSNLIKELDEIPHRSLWSSLMTRLRHAVRWQ